MSDPVLSVQELTVEFVTRRGTLRALDKISFEIARGEVLGVVGESGAGKSVTGSAIIGLIDPPGRIADGKVVLSGERVDHLPPEQMRRVRGKRFQSVEVHRMHELAGRHEQVQVEDRGEVVELRHGACLVEYHQHADVGCHEGERRTV